MSERAAIAADSLPMLQAEAKKRRSATLVGPISPSGRRGTGRRSLPGPRDQVLGSFLGAARRGWKNYIGALASTP